MNRDSLFENLETEYELIHRSKYKQVYYVNHERNSYYLKVYNTKKYDIYALERLNRLLMYNDIICPKIEILSINEQYGLIREEKCNGTCLADVNDENLGKLMYSVGNRIASLNLLRYENAEDIIPMWEYKTVCAIDIYENIFNYIDKYYLFEANDRLFYCKCKQMIEIDLKIEKCHFSHNDLNLFHIFSLNSKCSGLIDFDMLSKGGAHLNISQAFFSIIDTRFELYGKYLLAGYNDGMESYKKCSAEMIFSYLWVYLLWKICVCINQNKKDALDYYTMKFHKLKKFKEDNE